MPTQRRQQPHPLRSLHAVTCLNEQHSLTVNCQHKQQVGTLIASTTNSKLFGDCSIQIVQIDHSHHYLISYIKNKLISLSDLSIDNSIEFEKIRYENVYIILTYFV